MGQLGIVVNFIWEKVFIDGESNDKKCRMVIF